MPLCQPVTPAVIVNAGVANASTITSTAKTRTKVPDDNIRSMPISTSLVESGLSARPCDRAWPGHLARSSLCGCASPAEAVRSVQLGGWPAKGKSFRGEREVWSTKFGARSLEHEVWSTKARRDAKARSAKARRAKARRAKARRREGAKGEGAKGLKIARPAPFFFELP